LNATYCALAVLPSHGVVAKLFKSLWAYRTQDLRFGVAHRIRSEYGRRFHCSHGKQLQSVILDNVTQRARVVVILAPLLYADSLCDGDLYVIDKGAVPDGFDNAVGESKDKNVLDCLFAEIMVNAIDLRFVKDQM
jgi:hypothetical protein